MNQRDMEKEIWKSLLVIVENFEDFDNRVYLELYHIGEETNRPSQMYAALDRVAALISKKVA